LSKQIKPGKWVMSYSPGIWQVFRVVKYKVRDVGSRKEAEHTMVFSKRFISKSGKPSFSEECCELSLVEPIDDDVKRKLESFIAENPAAWKRFEAYEPKQIDMIYNARISIPEEKTVESFEKEIPKGTVLTDFEIEALLKELGVWDISGFQQAQFVSYDFACKGGYLAYSFNRVLTFGVEGSK
jgi:hypothetical protein